MPLLKSLKNFRPRLGMGWFDSIGYITSNANNVFVPAWGWGGSRMIKSRHTAISKFSSPLGDGLVLEIKTESIYKWQSNFRPRLGTGWFSTTIIETAKIS